MNVIKYFLKTGFLMAVFFPIRWMLHYLLNHLLIVGLGVFQFVAL